jgi:hypothetical protein
VWGDAANRVWQKILSSEGFRIILAHQFEIELKNQYTLLIMSLIPRSDFNLMCKNTFKGLESHFLRDPRCASQRRW